MDWHWSFVSWQVLKGHWHILIVFQTFWGTKTINYGFWNSITVWTSILKLWPFLHFVTVNVWVKRIFAKLVILVPWKNVAKCLLFFFISSMNKTLFGTKSHYKMSEAFPPRFRLQYTSKKMRGMLQLETGLVEAGVQGVPGHTQYLSPHLIKPKFWTERKRFI